MRVRAIRGVDKCARCGREIGVLNVNGREVAIELESAILDDALVFERHRCDRRPPADDRPDETRTRGSV